MLTPYLAGERIHHFVAGYPSSVRAAKQLLFLQAYIDDSACEEGDRRLFMAGYINSVDAWSAFAEHWQRELNNAPSVAYLRMVEAKALRGQFRGWQAIERDKKLERLAALIRLFMPESFHFSVDRKDFDNLIAPNVARGIGSPHYVGVFAIVAMVTRYLAKRGVEAKVDFIFDQQSGVDADIAIFFEYMTKNIPKEARKLISGIPIFRDDKDMVPLQAADMLAWHLRRQHQKGDVEQMLDLLFYEDGGHLVTHANNEVLQRISYGLRQIPSAGSMRSKSDWQRFRREITGLKASGFIPPMGTKWRNFLFETRQQLYWLLRRRR